jgi:hypothetical protein
MLLVNSALFFSRGFGLLGSNIWVLSCECAPILDDELLARSQYRAPGLRLVGLWLWFVLSEVAMVWLFSLVAKLFFLLCRLPAMGFYPPPLSLPFLLFSFPPSSSLRSSQAFFGSPTHPRHSGPSPMSSS